MEQFNNDPMIDFMNQILSNPMINPSPYKITQQLNPPNHSNFDMLFSFINDSIFSLLRNLNISFNTYNNDVALTFEKHPYKHLIVTVCQYNALSEGVNKKKSMEFHTYDDFLSFYKHNLKNFFPRLLINTKFIWEFFNILTLDERYDYNIHPYVEPPSIDNDWELPDYIHFELPKSDPLRKILYPKINLFKHPP